MNNWFNVPTAQTSIFVVFVSAGVLFDGALSLWVSLSNFSSGEFNGVSRCKQLGVENFLSIGKCIAVML